MIVGDSGVGKTYLFNQLSSTGKSTDGPFTPSPTIGINVKILKHRTCFESAEATATSEAPPTTSTTYINVMLMDTCGLTRFQNISLQFLHGTHAYLVMFDVGNRQTFLGAKKWIQSITQHHIDKVAPPGLDNATQDLVLLLIGTNLNKNSHASNPTTHQDIDELLLQHGNIDYHELDDNSSPQPGQWFCKFTNKALNQGTLNSCILPLPPSSLSANSNSFSICNR